MARIQFSGQGLVLFPTRSSSPTTKTTFDLVSGSIGPPIRTKVCLSSTVEVLRKTFAKLRWFKPTCLDRSGGKLDAALDNLVSACGNANAALRDIDLEVADCHLSDTLYLRATPLASLLLSGVGNVDDRTYTKVVDQLLDVRDNCAPEIFRHIAKELRDVASMEVLRVPFSIAFSPLPKSSSHCFPRKTTLALRRDQRVLTMEDLPKVAIPSKKPDEPAEHNLAFLRERVIEDPDFCIIPIWHGDSVAQRARLDYISQLPEDSERGFFDYAILAGKMLDEFKKFGGLSPATSLPRWRYLALKELRRVMDKEVDEAERCELNRLLRIKIEHLIPTTRIPKQTEALRSIELEFLKDAGVLGLSNEDVKDLLWTETRNRMRKSHNTMDPDQDYICDLISEYSKDTPLEYFLKPETIASDCNEVKLASITNWAGNIESPRYIHANLHNKYGRPEPDHDCAELIWAEIYMKSKYARPRLNLKEFAGRSNPALPPVEDFPDARSEGHYTNMLSDLSAGSLSSASEFFDPQAPEYPQTSVETVSLDSKVDDSDTNYNGCLSDDAHEPNSVIGELIAIGDSSDEVFGTNDTTANNSSAPSENTKNSGHQARHVNTLRMAHDGPHRAHGPEQPGFRGLTHSRPAPDWDAFGVMKPEYAQPKKAKVLGALDFFNLVFEAKERRMRKIVMKMQEEEKLAGVELRRLRYTGSAKIYDDPAPKFDMKVPIEHVTGSFTDLWPPRRPLYEGQMANENNPPSKFAVAPTRPATAPEFETGTMDIFGHISLSNQGAATALKTGVPLDSDDVFGICNDSGYESENTDVNDNVSLPNHGLTLSLLTGKPLYSDVVRYGIAFVQPVDQLKYAPWTPRNRIITDEVIAGWGYTPEAECVDEFF